MLESIWVQLVTNSQTTNNSELWTNHLKQQLVSLQRNNKTKIRMLLSTEQTIKLACHTPITSCQRALTLSWSKETANQSNNWSSNFARCSPRAKLSFSRLCWTNLIKILWTRLSAITSLYQSRYSLTANRARNPSRRNNMTKLSLRSVKIRYWESLLMCQVMLRSATLSNLRIELPILRCQPEKKFISMAKKIFKVSSLL